METWFKTLGISVLILCGALASGSAMADHVRFGVSVGVPLYAPGFYGPYPYPYPAYGYPYAYPPVVVQSAPPVYVEQGAAQAAPAQSNWYYCAASKSYYPYVSECPGGWQRVPSQPPR